MRIIVTESLPETLLTLVGDLDIAAVAKLRAAVHRSLVRGSDSIVVDLAGVTFLDSAGLRGLVFCHDRADSAGCTLTVTGRSAAVDRLLGLHGDEAADFLRDRGVLN